MNFQKITLLKLYHLVKKKIRYNKVKKSIGSLGNHSYIGSYYRIEGQAVSIGQNVNIADGSWIQADNTLNNSELELRIEDGCCIGRFNEIYATKSVVLERKVLTAERVYISDNLHGYDDINTPIIDQPIKQVKTVRIGEGSWLGAGVSVIGANIGKHCVIGTNAVVTKDIPDYSVAVGIPAKIIKRYNFSTKRWERTEPDGSFIEK